eukprot:gnl/TRDRNA2_/TRDRNA2_93776_c0_seq1.p1 gnl/TRDRNA2_/TRDRNA2_93776_c0~~gnl/TRDRNA2_/TRDRNA2_93776_c0_seq1.p1  ORF type:complete len:166 (+),score=22.38 gnl/TRDRNA2_/TRDRNA2_93776_c0_seq1:142-639(+)
MEMCMEAQMAGYPARTDCRWQSWTGGRSVSHRYAMWPLGGGYDLVCCSDCVLWPELSQPLVATLSKLLDKQNAALISIVNRGAVAAKFLACLRQSFHLEEVWTSPAEGLAEEGHMKIYRVLWRPVKKLPKAFERIVGVPEGWTGLVPVMRRNIDAFPVNAGYAAS